MYVCCVFFPPPYKDGTTGNTTSFSSNGNASNGTEATQFDAYAPWYPSPWDDATIGPGKPVRYRCYGSACFFSSFQYWWAIKDESRFGYQDYSIGSSMYWWEYPLKVKQPECSLAFADVVVHNCSFSQHNEKNTALLCIGVWDVCAPSCLWRDNTFKTL